MDFYKKKLDKYTDVANECLLCLFCYFLLVIQMTTFGPPGVQLILATAVVIIVIVLLSANISLLVYKMLKKAVKLIKKRKNQKDIKINKVIMQLEK